MPATPDAPYVGGMANHELVQWSALFRKEDAERKAAEAKQKASRPRGRRR